ncbi:MAG: xanthine dehydrogenase small subunit, partial [Paraburkholderia nemoris]
MTEPIRFYHRNAIREIKDAPVTRTVLQYLREDVHCTGTKEGCAEGDCGACTVVIGERNEAGGVDFKAVNACIQFVPTLDGKALFTVEDLRQPDGSLHPVQEAMVECHGSQCGFCTPGFVMSMWSLYEKHGHEHSCANKTVPSRDAISNALTGNLCRCTGYRPIVDAAVRMFEAPAPKAPVNIEALSNALATLERKDTFHYQHAGQQFDAPRTVAALAKIKEAEPAARILAGSTDIGLWVTKMMRELGNIVYVGQIAELQKLETNDDWIEIGAGVSVEKAYTEIIKQYPELFEMQQRFASLPIRNAGTLGGNIANGSPIGDSMPGLIALGARVIVRGGEIEREMPLEDLYLAYQKK